MFFLPYRINRPFKLPVVTISLIVINVIVYALSVPFIPQVWEQFGFRADAAGFYTWFTSMFLHGDAIGHLGGNMYFLWLFGSVVEDAIGRLRYILLYVAGGLAAALINSIVGVVWTPEGHGIPLIGASGAIAAVIGVFAVRLYRHKVKIFYLIFVKPGTFELSSLVAVGLWMAREVFDGVASILVGGSSVANWAHVGGAIFGGLTALLLGLAGDADVEFLTEEAEAYASTGVPAVAASRYSQLLAADPNNPQLLLERARTSLAAANGNGGYSAITAPAAGGPSSAPTAAEDIAKCFELLTRSGRSSEIPVAYEQLLPMLGATSLPAKALLAAGSACETARRLDLAAKAYWDLVQGHPQTRDAEKALFRLPHVYLAAGMPGQAAQVWQSFVATYPASEWIPFADRALTVAS